MGGLKRQSGAALYVVIGAVIIVGAVGLILFIMSQPANVPGNPEILQQACKTSVNDYPKWAIDSGDIIIWENPGRDFNFRNSPEEASSKIDDPVGVEETLVDMDFLGTNEISYVAKKTGGWKVGLFKLNGLNEPSRSIIYEKDETFSEVALSPINRSDFIAFIANQGQGVLRRIDTSKSKEETIFQSALTDVSSIKLAVSPKATYVYLLSDNTLAIFDITSQKQIDSISLVKSAVWLGDKYVLYSGKDASYIYKIESKEKTKVENVGAVQNLTFNPKRGGTIAFDQKGNTKIIGCEKLGIINSKQGAEFKTLTSERTAITKKGQEYGYWRFVDKDWGVKILEDKSKFVTVWQRY